MADQKIAILHFTCPPVVGGVEIIMAAHARLFAQAGYDVTVIAGRGPVPDSDDPRITTVIESLVDSKNPRLLEINSSLDAGRVPEDFAAYEAETFTTLEKLLEGYDACIVHNAFTLHKNLPLTSALLRLAESLPQTRFISWCHDLAWTNPLYAPVLYEREPWTLLKRNSPHVTYVAISPQRQDEILATFEPPLVAQNVPIVPNGVSLTHFLKLGNETRAVLQAAELDSPADDLILLLPARITRRKNVELAVKVTAALKAQGQPVKMVITGPPGPHNPKNDEYVRELLTLRAELQVQNEVIFLMEKWRTPEGLPRTISDEVIADLYRYADALFFPSTQEGFGIPMLEAGLARLPIFASRLNPFVEIAGELPHYFAPDDDPAAIAGMITTELEQNRQHRLRRKVIEQYTWESIFAKQIEPLVGG
jgi:mannosylglucosylglycerate synthase